MNAMRNAGLLFVTTCSMVLLGGGACAGKGTTGAPADDASIALLDDAGVCGVTTRRFDVVGARHVPVGTVVPYASNPPSGGDHYAIWLSWGAHDAPVPPGHWVHNLEHGGVALLYRCANRAACPELAGQLESIAAAVPQDARCTVEAPGVRGRVLVLPDPDLPDGVQVAAAAWGYTLVARCVDAPLLRQFYVDHEGHGPEDLCADGVDVTRDAAPVSDAGEDAGGDAGDAAGEGG